MLLVRSRGLGATPTPQVQSIANAIAYAEGYFQPGSPGTINSPNVAPVRNNNPCDLGGAGQSYPTIDAGWNACYGQVGAMLGGTSAYYSPTDTISDIAPTYTGNDNSSSWAAAVAQALGVSPSTPLNQIGASGGSVAQTSSDSSAGLQTSASGIFADSIPSDVGSGFSLLDDSGNLTGWGWAAVVVVVGGIALLAIN